ncbi:fluoride efflux transporter CrcB [Catenovulum maritimum]|uniref:Fluoride-specific ion channel FluC n=1 Tax=Catenovulum maritimum TaxID=1513271 RepID=A0A0J8GRL4_9ALTE|nr:fluoride efflux transporter CrcB [Catenovulum maritimum]KMT63929.1 camphor resistance protein CrcB [Catenovulum maritimum]
MNNLLTYTFIAIGGATGACLRYFLSQLALIWFGKSFPFGTLLVNILGSLLIGFLYTLIAQGWLQLVPWRTFIGIGFLGALTTFSTFSMDTLLLAQQGDWVKAVLNVVFNVVICLFAVWAGSKLAGLKL